MKLSNTLFYVKATLGLALIFVVLYVFDKGTKNLDRDPR